MRKLTNILLTGGCGFIGSNFVRQILNDFDFNGKLIVLDKLTYAGYLGSLEDLKDRFIFVEGDICNKELVEGIFKEHDIDTVINFAAESHVDRSITGPAEFINTNILGTFILLEAAREYWSNREDVLFHHVSTDEVFGTLGETGYFFEDTPYDPRSPYSASKASSDHLVRAYFHTYNLPVTLSNCTNNYGPYQFPEKLIPVMINNIVNKINLPVYGDGKNIRDWIHVEDHNIGVWEILTKGRLGESYNIGGENEWENIKLVETLCDIVDAALKREVGQSRELITFVTDRPGHDRRYAINCDKIKNELGWVRTRTFEQGLGDTVKWYLDNQEWVQKVKNK